MEENSSVLLDGRSECKECARNLILLATHRVYIISQQLEPEIYNDREIYQHLTSLTTRNRKTDIRIIAHDTRLAANQGHFLINLAQKLPTFAQIRTTVTAPNRKFIESWLIVDDMAYMRIKDPARFEGNSESNNKLECKSYINSFEKIWEASLIDQNTRRLGI